MFSDDCMGAQLVNMCDIIWKCSYKIQSPKRKSVDIIFDETFNLTVFS